MKKRRTIILLAVGISAALAFLFPLPTGAQTVAIEKMPQGELVDFIRRCPAGNALRCARLQEYFKILGCPLGRIATQSVKGSPEPNIIATLPGLSDSTILVGAHFDYSPWGSPLVSPGVIFPSKGVGLIDNWSGALLLPVLYKSLCTRPRQHTFIFIGFAAEEKGLKGSKSYVAQMTPGSVSRTKAMINLDCLGLGTTAVCVDRSDPTLWEHMMTAAAVTQLPLRGVNMPRVFHFDAEAFRKFRIPTMIVHSTTQETVFTPHSFLDNLMSMHCQEYYDSYILIAAFLAYLDLKLK